MEQFSIGATLTNITLAGGASSDISLSSANKTLYPNTLLYNTGVSYPVGTFSTNDPLLIRRCRFTSVFSGTYNFLTFYRENNGPNYRVDVGFNTIYQMGEWADCNLTLPSTNGNNRNLPIILASYHCIVMNDSSATISNTTIFVEMELVCGMGMK